MFSIAWPSKNFGPTQSGLDSAAPLPKMIVAQAAGCAPIVRAFRAGEERAVPWENPTTHASGLRVPGPLGDRLILRALRESAGEALAVSDRVLVLSKGTTVFAGTTDEFRHREQELKGRYLSV